MQSEPTHSQLVEAGRGYLLRIREGKRFNKARQYALRQLAVAYPRPYRRYREVYLSHCPNVDKDLDLSMYSEEDLVRYGHRSHAVKEKARLRREAKKNAK